MSKFSRNDIRQFFRDTISEMYDYDDDPRMMLDPVTGEEINIDIMRVGDEELEPAEIRRRTRARRRANPPPPVDVRMPTEDEFDEIMALRRLRRGKLREMIEEAIRLGYKDMQGGDRSEYYGGPSKAMGYDEDELFDDDAMGLHAMDIMGDPYSIDMSSDVMDGDIELHPSDDLGRMEREMMGQGRYPNHHHDGDDDDLDLDLLGDDLDTYNSGDDLVMERQKIRQMISDVLKQG